MTFRDDQIDFEGQVNMNGSKPQDIGELGLKNNTTDTDDPDPGFLKRVNGVLKIGVDGGAVDLVDEATGKIPSASVDLDPSDVTLEENFDGILTGVDSLAEMATVLDNLSITAPSAIPVGAIILWDQSSTCPAGYTRVTTLDGKFLKSSSTPQLTGGSSTHTHTIPDHNHGIGSHTHTYSGVTGSPSDQNSTAQAGGPGSTYSSTGHDHEFSGTTSASSGSTTNASIATDSSNFEPPFYTVLLCRKD